MLEREAFVPETKAFWATMRKRRVQRFRRSVEYVKTDLRQSLPVVLKGRFSRERFCPRCVRQLLILRCARLTVYAV
jgi:hypothetical protein